MKKKIYSLETEKHPLSEIWIFQGKVEISDKNGMTAILAYDADKVYWKGHEIDIEGFSDSKITQYSDFTFEIEPL